MIFSASPSYYDQHLHTKGVVRKETKSNKPTLLTDRGAYLNYLEVQLERVSTACLSVQAYDERFNDMQSLIVSLDSKIYNLNNMLTLSQKRNVFFFP